MAQEPSTLANGGYSLEWALLQSVLKPLLHASCLLPHILPKVEVVQQNCLDECPMGPNCGVPRADDAGAPQCGRLVQLGQADVAVVNNCLSTLGGRRGCALAWPAGTGSCSSDHQCLGTLACWGKYLKQFSIAYYPLGRTTQVHSILFIGFVPGVHMVAGICRGTCGGRRRCTPCGPVPLLQCRCSQYAQR